LLLTLFSAACAHVPGPETPVQGVAATARQWQLGGRFVAGQSQPQDGGGSEPVAGRFAWQHQPGADTLWLIGPLGNALARVDISPTGVRWQDAAGKRGEGTNLRALGESLAGIRLPDVAADAWLRGRWSVADVLQRDAQGRVVQARAGGWQFDYRYGAPAPASWPLAVEGQGPEGLWLRVALTEWDGVSDPAEQPAP
jgi:outer membrane biogenesis lipoprotein LolB